MVREAIETAKTLVEEIVEGLAECEIEVELPDPEDDDLAPIRHLLELG